MNATRLLVLQGGDAYFGVDTQQVREVVPAKATTRIPGAPTYVRGLLNLRGTLVTVVDLAERLGRAKGETSDPSVAIVHSGTRLLGLLVDDVLDVQELTSEEELSPSPIAGGSGDGGLVRGLGHFDDRVVIVIDVEELVRQTLA